MLKGAIDEVHPQRVGGWMYSAVKNVRGSEVLAFVDQDCVGAGRVEVFRQDLVDAGLGDGFSGFSFPVSLNQPSDCYRITVRINDSDFILVPPGAHVRSTNRFEQYAVQPYNSTSIEFMRRSGWLANAELSFLRFMLDLGVFDLSLVRPKSEQLRGIHEPLNPKTVASEQLRLLTLQENDVREFELFSPSGEEIVSAVHRLSPKPYSIIALHANDSSTLEVVEGSHKDEVKTSSLDGSVEHPLGLDKLLFVNLLCAFDLQHVSDANVTMFYMS